MKKTFYILTIFISMFIFINNVNAESACDKSSLEQLAKIIYREVGTDAAVDSSENFFMRLNTASIVLNNADNKSGSNWYQKIYNLTDNNYGGYSNYKDKTYDNVVTTRKGEMLYIASLVLNGQYNLPKNMTLQASEEIVNRWGTVWYCVKTVGNYYDVYFGYSGTSISNTDVFGKNITNNTVNYYKQLADSLKKNDYSQYTSDNACNLVATNDMQVTYNISYELNGGTWANGAKNPSKASTNEVLIIDNPVKTITIVGEKNSTNAIIGNQVQQSQTFAGWTSSKDLGLSADAKTGTSTNPNTIWNGSKITNKYFKSLRNTSGTVKLNAVWTPVSMKLPQISLENYNCKWNTKADGTGTSYDSEASYTPTANSASSIKLYAKCTKKSQDYTIQYNANGGTNAPSIQTKKQDIDILISSEIPSREGYTFISWNTLQNGSGIEYKSGQNYNKNESIILYATWEKNITVQTTNEKNNNPNTGVPSIIIYLLFGILSIYICYIYIKQINNQEY